MFSLEIGKDAAAVVHDVVDGRVFHKQNFRLQCKLAYYLINRLNLLIRSDSDSVLVYI